MKLRSKFWIEPLLAVVLGLVLPPMALTAWSGSPPEDEPHGDEPGSGVQGSVVLPPAPEPGAEVRPEEDGDRPGFGRRLFGRQRPRMDYDSLSDEEKERLERFMEQHFPERYEELSQLSETDPQQFFNIMNQMLPQMMRLMRMEKEDPPIFPLRVEEVKASWKIRILMRRLRQSSDPERREALRSEVRKTLEARFDLQQQLHGAEIARLESRLAEAKSALERRQADKDEIIAREFEDVTSGKLPPEGPPDRPVRERRPGGRGRPPVEP